LHDARSLDQGEVANVLSAQTIARTIAGPLWAQFVDRTGRPRAVLVLLSVLSLAAFGMFAAVESLPWLYVCAFVYGCVYPPMHPILDALALQTAQEAGFAYGRLRLVGSLSYLVVILGVGWWLDHHGSGSLFLVLVSGFAATITASFVLPERPVVAVPAGQAAEAPLAELLRSGPFVLLLVSAGLIQGSHATYYNLSTLHWHEHGIGMGTSGVLWAEGINAEIVLLWFARHSVDRLRPTTLIGLGGVAAAVRWCVVGATTSVPALLATNWLHAASFTCTYLGSMRALERRVKASQRSTAQGLLGAATAGVGMAVCGPIGGYCYVRWGGRAFFVMAAFAVLGTALAWLLRRHADRAATRPQPSTPNKPA
ncbi:MAG: MFS transporter, partial [Planctomycetota bacterium]|nr:MFS transporter [Planctomycetota bacterium]